MKHLLLSVALVACLAAGANAHSGMIALFSDTENHQCHAALGTLQTGNFYLMYVRGDGPRLGWGYEFRLLKSTSMAAILSPVWPTTSIPNGLIETGIMIAVPECFPDQAYVFLGTIPIMNIADPDTFTVRIVPDPAMLPPIAVVILECDPFQTMHAVSGGTFVFNGVCLDPLYPYGALATKETSWGAIKELYR